MPELAHPSSTKVIVKNGKTIQDWKMTFVSKKQHFTFQHGQDDMIFVEHRQKQNQIVFR